MERWSGRLALVTGASSGIGAAVAVALANNGMKVVGCARSVQKIQVSTSTLQNLLYGRLTTKHGATSILEVGRIKFSGLLGRRMAGWMDRWVDGWIDRRVVGWMIH